MASSKYMKGYTSKRSIKFCAIAAVVALSALSFGGSPAHASGSTNRASSPTPPIFSHVSFLVANPPQDSGIYKFCDGSNLVYELVIYDTVGSAGPNSMQVQFDSPQCQSAEQQASTALAHTPAKPLPTKKAKK